jgi:hypothetical protein
MREFLKTEQGLPSNGVTALAVDAAGRAYVGTGKGLCVYENGTFSPVILEGAVSMLFAHEDGVWVGTGTTLSLFSGCECVSSQEIGSLPVSMDTDDTQTLWLASSDHLYRYDGKDFRAYSPLRQSPVVAMAATESGGIYTALETHMQGLRLDGKRPRWAEITPFSSRIPSFKVTALASDGDAHLWVGTDGGLCLYDCNSEWLTYETIKVFPAAPVTKILLGENGAVYVGTTIGLYVFDGVKRSFLGCERWLPAQEVTALAASKDGGELWVGTQNGVSRITYQLMSLGEKAAFYQETLEKYNVREGYVMHRDLTEKGRVDSGSVQISDNDGIWTATYLAAQCFRYGATKSEEALALARRSKNALLKLMTVTGVAGCVARAYRRPGEAGFGDGDPEWTLVADENGPLEWKGEASSDEVTGHFFGLTNYYDICADEAEKEEISTALCTMIDCIVQNDYTLFDADGGPTTWGHWKPEKLNGCDKWFWEKNTNSLEMLAFLKACYFMSGNEKYEHEYSKLVRRHHFAMNCVQYKIEDNNVTHNDDMLTLLVMSVLLRYEQNPKLRRLYLLGLSHHWQTQRVERCPYWNVLYGALTGELCDIENAVKSLEEIPLDLVNWPVKNSHRPDIVWDSGQELFGGAPQLVAPLPYDEKSLRNYDHNIFMPDGDDGMQLFDPSNIYLVPYWMARYYKLIEEE